ncbi:MAG TPA: CHAD domain-containing protein [Ktedonobacterales bacterium]|nr:CHAD domain-containing protein [Ktedonobacterales bacterium]
MEVRTGKRSPDGHRNGVMPTESVSLGREPLAQVGLEALEKQLTRISDFVEPVCDHSDVEDIHQMRVATRRLRTMAHLLETTPAFRLKRVQRLRKQLQPLADRLGGVRDLDILLETLAEYEHSIEAVDESSETNSTLREDIEQRREKALKRLRKTLRLPKTQRMLDHPDKIAKGLIAHDQSARQMLVRHVAGGALWSRYEAILRFEAEVDGASEASQLHPLRIACKHLRYALELFSDDDDPCAQSLLSTLKEVQTHLGDLQDSVFAIALLDHLGDDHPDDALLAGFHADQETRQTSLLKHFTPLWENISGAPYRRDLATFIAAL